MFERIKSLISAMVNNGVNKMETPEVLLEQAEMELQKNAKQLKEALTQSITSEKMLEKQQQKNAEEVSTWEKRATVAVQAGNDTVATECLKKKQEFTQAAHNMQEQMAQQKATTANLRVRAAEIDEKLKEFLRKKPEMLSRSKAGDSIAKANELISGTTGGSSMDKWEEKIRAKEIMADPLGTSADDLKFKALDTNHELDDELAALKAKVNAPKGDTEIKLIPTNDVPRIELLPPDENDASKK